MGLFNCRSLAVCSVCCFLIASGSLVADDEFETLFNGRDLSGWTGAVEDYEVREGAIACKAGRGGVLYTEKEFANFELQLEFKLPPGGNNGLAIRYPGEGSASYDGMCELQVLDNTADKYSNLDPRQYHGSVYGIAAAERGHLKPAGEWNEQTVRVVGSTITVDLNGHRILNADVSRISQFKDGSAHPGLALTKGHVGFAGHNDPVMFRALRIKPLPAPDSYWINARQRAQLAEHLLFHAGFDGSLDAEVSVGDGRIRTAQSTKRENVEIGNQLESVGILPKEGRFRDALQFNAKTNEVLFYEGSEVGYKPQEWSGSVSCWLRLDPDKDLEPGFCDPVQITERAWNDAAFFVDFDKQLPRDFRLGVFSDYAVWNPSDRKWDEIETDQRPMVVVERPPFAADRWTHVCFTWHNVNATSQSSEPADGTEKGAVRLYLNGKSYGQLAAPFRFTWDPGKAAMMIGVNYIGLLDDLAVFDVALTPEQVRLLHEYPMGIRYLRADQ